MNARFQWAWLWLMGPLGFLSISVRFWYEVGRDGATGHSLFNAALCSAITIAVSIGVMYDLKRRARLQAKQSRL